MADKFIKNGVCDFVSKFQYDEYQRVLDQIPDDPSFIPGVLKEMKKSFLKTRKTFNVEYRLL